MDWAFVLVLQIMIQPSLSVLFTVEAEQPQYIAEFGGEVVMGCRFQPKLLSPNDNLMVTWQRVTSSPAWEVYRIDNGVEQSASQHPDYQGRVKLFTKELANGWAKLLRMNDSGTYQCLVKTREGADYKKITLSVTAPYRTVTKHIQKAAEGNEVLLTCQSEGYPESSVIWQDAHLQTIEARTIAAPTPDQLFKVTSEIRVPSSERNNYTCTFKDGHSATFHIPDEMPVPDVKHDGLIVLFSIGVILLVIIVAVLMFRRRKGNHSILYLFVALKLVNFKICTVADRNHNLGAFVKAHYSNSSFSSDARRRMEAFGAEELPQRLQNSEGKPVNLQGLLPEAGETLFLEGPPGSGKTYVAHILVSSWTEGPKHALSHVLDLNTVRVLLYVDCSIVKRDLFQETADQLSLTKKISTEDELRTVLTRSGEVLLLLDGYREGNQHFDESLKRFLSQKGRCRVLVTARPGDCPTFRDTVGTEKLLELKTQTVKY
uniref:Ig-like domain-containing protein n=1 Tax=Sparus aurata TaxID=8175 RepID=A0A671XVS6_SPAAU